MKTIDVLVDGIKPSNVAAAAGVLAGHAAVLNGVNTALNDKAADKKTTANTTPAKTTEPKQSAASATPLKTNGEQPEIKKDVDPTSDRSVNGKLFHDRVKEISKKLGVRSSDLLRIMEFESGMNPAKANGKNSGAVGLIQFMPRTIKGMWPNLSATEIQQMPAADQLLLVWDFYKRNNLPAGSDLPTMYLFTYMPAAAKEDNNFVLARSGAYNKKIWDVDMGQNWDQNPAFANEAKRQGRNYFTVGDVKNVIQAKH